MTDLVRKVTFGRAEKKKLESFNAGDTVKVHVRIKEGDKERIQIYQGVVLKVQGSGMGKTFTVRKMSSGVGVERTFPFVSPAVEKVEVIAYGKVRRSRLFYQRQRSGKAAKIVSELAVTRKGRLKAEAEKAGNQNS